MSKRVQMAGGPASQENTYTGPSRELRVDTSNSELRLHDGATVGGIRIPSKTGNDVLYQAKSTELSAIGPFATESRGVLVKTGASTYALQTSLSGLNVDMRGKSLQLDDAQIPASKISGLGEGGAPAADAANTSYDNSTSGMAAGNVQAGLDEIITYLEDIQTEVDAGYATANGAYAQANSGFNRANSAYSQANSAYDKANASHTTANSAFAQANTANSTATSAFTQANTANSTATSAFTQANAGFTQANSAFTQANSAYGQANSATSTATSAYSRANAGFDQANAAFGQANSAYGQANTATTTATSAYGQANAGFNQANSAFGAANGAAATAGTANSTANTAVAGVVPIGGIIDWSGSIASLAALAPRWYLCDGTHGTPNLIDRMTICAGNQYAVGDIGGSETHTHSVTGGAHDHSLSVDSHSLTIAEMPAHTHTVNGGTGTGTNLKGVVDRQSLDGTASTSSQGLGGGHSHGITVGGDGSHTHTTAAGSSLPPYYALAKIMRAS